MAAEASIQNARHSSPFGSATGRSRLRSSRGQSAAISSSSTSGTGSQRWPTVGLLSEHARSLLRGGRPGRLGGSRPDLRRRRLRRGPIRRRARETRPASSRSGRPSESTLAQATTQCSLKRLTRPSDASGSYVATPSNLGCVGSESGVGVEPALPLQVRDACHFRLSRLPSLTWPMGCSRN